MLYAIFGGNTICKMYEIHRHHHTWSSNKYVLYLPSSSQHAGFRLTRTLEANNNTNNNTAATDASDTNNNSSSSSSSNAGGDGGDGGDGVSTAGSNADTNVYETTSLVDQYV